MSGTTFTVANSSATPAQRLEALQASTPTSLPGVSAALVGLEKGFAQHTQAIAGVLPNGVAILNTNASLAQQQALLASTLPVSIPGVSAARVAYYKQLAKQGKLKGVSTSGQPIF